MILETHAAPPFFKNGYVLGCESTRDAVVIDPGDEVALLLQSVQQHGLRPSAILLTHAHLDHVTGVRIARSQAAYPSGHQLGNRVFNRTVSVIFGRPVNDLLSGYRVFSRRFVKSFPAISRAFEIETELAVHALQHKGRRRMREELVRLHAAPTVQMAA